MGSLGSFSAHGATVSSPATVGIRWGTLTPNKDANKFVRLRCALVDAITSLDFKNQPHDQGPYLQAALPDKNHANKKCLWSLTITDPNEVKMILKSYKLESKRTEELSGKILSFQFRIITEALLMRPLARSATLPLAPIEPDFRKYSIIAEARAFDGDGNPVTALNDWSEEGERLSSRPYSSLEVRTSYHEYGRRPSLAADIRMDWKIIEAPGIVDVAGTTNWDVITALLVYEISISISRYGNFLSQKHREAQLMKTPDPLKYMGYMGYPVKCEGNIEGTIATDFRRAPLVVVNQELGYAGFYQTYSGFLPGG